MIQPVLQGPDLLEQIAATDLDDDHLALWWLGQCGYAVRWRDRLVLVDPPLSNQPLTGSTDPAFQREMPPAFDPAELTGADLVLVTQRRNDLFDPEAIPALLAASSQAVLVVPAGLADYAADDLDIPDPRLVPIRDGEIFERRGLRVQALPGAPEEAVEVPTPPAAQFSYLLGVDAHTLFFAGSARPFSTQAARVAELRPDIAILPISGRDARRQKLGLRGTLTIAEAARLAAASGAEVVIPCHYGLYPVEAGDADAFVEHCGRHHPSLRSVVLRPAECWPYPNR